MLILLALLTGSLWKVLDRPLGSSTSVAASSAYTSGHAELLSLYGEDLPFEPRLSASGRRAGASGVVEGGSVLAFAGDGFERRVRAEARIERDLATAPAAETRAAAGVRDLLGGNIGRGIAALEAARLARPDDPRILNDLAAAHLVWDEDEGRGVARVKALSWALRAVELDPQSPEWQFNLALALEALHLELAAREAWERYLEMDSRSPWAERARRHLEAFEEEPRWRGRAEAATRLQELDGSASGELIVELSRRSPERLLDHAERELLPRWARAIESGDLRRAERVLARVQSIAAALGSGRGARPLELMVDWLTDETERNRRRVARAHLLLTEGLESFEAFDVGTAEAALEAAARELADLGSPYALRARHYLALCLYQRTEYDEASKAVSEIVLAARALPDLVVLGHALHAQGTILDSQKRPLEALARYEAALAVYREAGWSGRAAGIESLIAGVRSSLGQEEPAWDHRLRALADSSWILESRHRVRSWSEATGAAERAAGPEVARFFADELVRAAEEANEPLLAATALRQRATVLYPLGEREGALDDLDTASDWIDQVVDSTVAESARGDLLLYRGELLAEDDPPEALAALDEAGRLFEATRYESMFPRLLLARSKANRALGAKEEAEADLDAALSEAEQALGRLTDPLARMTYAEKARSLYDEALAVAVETGRADVGLEYAERIRSALLTRDRVSEVEALTQAARRVPSSTTVLVYHLLPDRLLVWVLRSGGSRLIHLPVGRESLETEVRRLRAALTTGGEWHDAAERLYGTLLEPAADELAGTSDLVVIPDGAIHGVPFAALVNPVTGRLLVRDFRVRTSPLLSLALPEPGEPAGDRFDASAAVLAVAPPAGPSSAGSLSALPHARAEVERLSQLFPRTTLLRGEQANKRAFLEEAETSSLVHFGGHAEANPRFPLASSLILAPEDDSDGRLYVFELLEGRLRTPRLVVFSACSSSVGPGGLTSLTGAVVAAGVPVAVGSLWEVADRPTAAFFERFYSELREGADPVAALRTTQLSLLESSDPELSHPRTWAAFQASGVARVASEE